MFEIKDNSCNVLLFNTSTVYITYNFLQNWCAELRLSTRALCYREISPILSSNHIWMLLIFQNIN